MPPNPFLRFHRAAEAAAYPALLIVSMICLTLVVVPVMLLGLTRAGWVLVVALLFMLVAIAILSGEIEAALSDAEEPPVAPTSEESGVAGDPEAALARAGRERAIPPPGQDSKAA